MMKIYFIPFAAAVLVCGVLSEDAREAYPSKPTEGLGARCRCFGGKGRKFSAGNTTKIADMCPKGLNVSYINHNSNAVNDGEYDWSFVISDTPNLPDSDSDSVTDKIDADGSESGKIAMLKTDGVAIKGSVKKCGTRFLIAVLTKKSDATVSFNDTCGTVHVECAATNLELFIGGKPADDTPRILPVFGDDQQLQQTKFTVQIKNNGDQATQARSILGANIVIISVKNPKRDERINEQGGRTDTSVSRNETQGTEGGKTEPARQKRATESETNGSGSGGERPECPNSVKPSQMRVGGAAFFREEIAGKGSLDVTSRVLEVVKRVREKMPRDYGTMELVISLARMRNRNDEDPCNNFDLINVTVPCEGNCSTERPTRPANTTRPGTYQTTRARRYTPVREGDGEENTGEEAKRAPEDDGVEMNVLPDPKSNGQSGIVLAGGNTYSAKIVLKNETINWEKIRMTDDIVNRLQWQKVMDELFESGLSYEFKQKLMQWFEANEDRFPNFKESEGNEDPHANLREEFWNILQPEGETTVDGARLASRASFMDKLKTLKVDVEADTNMLLTVLNALKVSMKGMAKGEILLKLRGFLTGVTALLGAVPEDGFDDCRMYAMEEILDYRELLTEWTQGQNCNNIKPLIAHFTRYYMEQYCRDTRGGKHPEGMNKEMRKIMAKLAIFRSGFGVKTARCVKHRSSPAARFNMLHESDGNGLFPIEWSATHDMVSVGINMDIGCPFTKGLVCYKAVAFWGKGGHGGEDRERPDGRDQSSPSGETPPPTRSQPSEGGEGPVPTRSQPDTGGEKPDPTTSQPSKGGERPGPTSSQPDTGGEKPGPTTSQPDTGGEKPGPIRTQPDIGSEKPGLTTAQPDTGGEKTGDRRQ